MSTDKTNRRISTTISLENWELKALHTTVWLQGYR